MNKKVFYFALILTSIIVFSCDNNKKKVKSGEGIAEMTFSNKTYDFGSINHGDIVATEFEFSNSGNSDLLITEAIGSCGCTVPEFPKRAIKPGEKEKIKVIFNSTGKTGMQNKTVTITSNTQSGIETLYIKANVIPRIGIAQ
ncbi:DUF1573 domain-containing protein [Flavobacterium sp. 5]|uniref:DUF1573 domain-containing protein n=1 Tax=Flavobacterium sp. 5 TaxID=2035199 RepID=UPI000C2BE580|nr:DUF1573 domain-containing protein [Flavobacterium sp. 5]PKB15540.1 uncharacterized protein DUF1573 [Flavobacterium sp. 5]